MSDIDLVLDETEETAPVLDLGGTADLDEDESVPRQRRPTLRDRDSERSAARSTRSASRAPINDLPVWPAQGPVTRVAGAATTSMGPKLATTDVAVPPVLVPLAHKQYEMVQMSGEQAAAYAARIRDAFNPVQGQGHFPLASHRAGGKMAETEILWG